MIHQSFKCRAAILRTLYLVAGIRSLHIPLKYHEITELKPNVKDRTVTPPARLVSACTWPGAVLWLHGMQNTLQTCCAGLGSALALRRRLSAVASALTIN